MKQNSGLIKNNNKMQHLQQQKPLKTTQKKNKKTQLHPCAHDTFSLISVSVYATNLRNISHALHFWTKKLMPSFLQSTATQFQ